MSAGASNQYRRISIAERTLAAVDAGRYLNERLQGVVFAREVADAVAGTVLHELGEPLRPPAAHHHMTISVTGEPTLGAMIRLDAQGGGHLACLNFAAAKHPGGGFLGGAMAQEESLARSSALYACLRRQPSYYERHRAHASHHYLDLAIFSPHVPFVCDDEFHWLDRPVLASVLTCAAPMATALRGDGELDPAPVEATLRRRAGFILAVAAHHRVERLVLGAWGAGVHGNDPVIVADAFATWLEGLFSHAFTEVVFALHGEPGKRNYDAFAARFAR